MQINVGGVKLYRQSFEKLTMLPKIGQQISASILLHGGICATGSVSSEDKLNVFSRS